jgi:hypothetical protein
MKTKMNTKIHSQSGFLGPRALIAFLFCGSAACLSGHPTLQRNPHRQSSNPDPRWVVGY